MSGYANTEKVYYCLNRRRTLPILKSFPTFTLSYETNSVQSQGTQNHNSRAGSQIIRICMEIYIKIDKMVKMYKNSY